MTAEVIEADLTWTGNGFAPGVRIAVDADGRIAHVGASGSPTRRLSGQAVLPGLVNVHSHAFQRGLRGKGERFPDGTGSFWTWREAMYRLVESLDRDAFIAVCAQAYREMRDAGITAVGEFHYLHHSPGAADYAFDAAVLEAARAAGIRIVLLNTFYQTGGIGQALKPAQQRFASRTPAAYWTQMDHLVGLVDGRRETLGTAVHSVRAAGLDETAAIFEEARRRGMPFHIHVEEQRKEIDESLAAYGKTPMAVLKSLLAPAAGVVAVHCTHTRSDDMEDFLESGGRVCACPLTEGNLGDGIPTLSHVLARAGRLSLGTDSNARIAMIDEMRWLEYGQRLQHQARGVVVDAAGCAARRLFDVATVDGAAALGLECGTIEPGMWADFLTVDLAHPTLAGAAADELLDAIVFGAGNEVIGATCVAGDWRDAATTPRTPRPK